MRIRMSKSYVTNLRQSILYQNDKKLGTKTLLDIKWQRRSQPPRHTYFEGFRHCKLVKRYSSRYFSLAMIRAFPFAHDTCFFLCFCLRYIFLPTSCGACWCSWWREGGVVQNCVGVGGHSTSSHSWEWGVRSELSNPMCTMMIPSKALGCHSTSSHSWVRNHHVHFLTR